MAAARGNPLFIRTWLDGRMRALPLLAILALPWLSGCHVAGALAGAEAASVTVLGRGVVDIGVSAVTGRDCSIVRLDRGMNYCAPREQLPAAPLFCSKSLGTVDCWTNPEAFIVAPSPLFDSPALTPDQTRDVGARWPKSLNL